MGVLRPSSLIDDRSIDGMYRKKNTKKQTFSMKNHKNTPKTSKTSHRFQSVARDRVETNRSRARAAFANERDFRRSFALVDVDRIRSIARDVARVRRFNGERTMRARRATANGERVVVIQRERRLGLGRRSARTRGRELRAYVRDERMRVVTHSTTTRTTRETRDDDEDADDDGDEGDEDDEVRRFDLDLARTRTSALKEIERAIANDDGVRRAMEKRREEAKDVATREIDKVKEVELIKVKEAYETMSARAGEVQTKAEEVALEAVEMKANAVKAAEMRMKAAESERAALEAELAREDTKGGKWATAIDEEREKLESGKAAALSGVGGAVLATPLILSQGGGAVSIAIAALSCAVFGVTYRYAVRQDVGNNELKGGVVGAFGLARGLSAADVYLRASALNGETGFATYAQAALLTGEGVLLYAFAAIALEQSFKLGILKTFGEAGER